MLLELKDIKKYYPVKKGAADQKRFVAAVDGVDLGVEQGQNLGLVGESGCGKTTLARIILRLLSFNQGSIRWDGKDVTDLKGSSLKDYRRKVQMVFQDPYSSLDPRFTINNILQEAFTLDSGRYRSQQDQQMRMGNILKAVGLSSEMLYRYPHEFSGGERQRIAIARALMLNPKLLILDEAVSSLDVVIQNQIIQLLKDLQKDFGLTYLFITHNLKVVRAISKRIAVMYKGKIVEMAPTEDIFNNPLHPYTQELLAAALDYKCVKREKEIFVDPQARLLERGVGHFVIE